MGIISWAGKKSAEVTAAKEKIKEKVADARDAIKEKKETVKEFASDPKGYIKKRYNDAREAELNKEAKDIEERLEKEKSVKEKADKKDKPSSSTGSSGGGGNFFSNLSSARSGGKWLRGESEGISIGWASILFLFALIFHIIDVFIIGYTRPSSLMMFLYIAFFIFAIFTLFGFHTDKNEIGLIIAIVLAYILPMVPTWFDNFRWLSILLAVISIMPPLVIYMMLVFPEKSGMHHFARVYIAFWLIVGIIVLMVNVGPSAIAGKRPVIKPLDALSIFFKGIGDSFKQFYQDTAKSIDIGFQRLVNPNYQGEEENVRGVFLEELRPIDSTYYSDSEVIVQARLRAKNIPGTINVSTICLIPGNKPGTVMPQNVQLMQNDETSLDCRLGALGKGGVYEVKFISTFYYQTDADVTYTFMNRQTYRLMTNQDGQSVNTQLEIPDRVVAKYTGGPIELGLPSEQQPFLIDTSDPNNRKYSFGVSLLNKWTHGRVSKGHEYTLDVPDMVSLINCTRKHTGEYHDAKSGRRIYTFPLDKNNAKETFDSVTCKINVLDVNRLLGTGQKSEKTFSARAIYQYSIEQSTSLVVEGE